ncbi:hypothetical protein [Streptomyces cellulosae]|uniref:hypothetical protein n=1 Tax=Streptomyces cellulosae TaxID=1968 RepID=UPI000A730DF6|nr:hypothetical protein [Streptomyces cellulosae]
MTSAATASRPSLFESHRAAGRRHRGAGTGCPARAARAHQGTYDPEVRERLAAVTDQLLAA